MSPSGFSFRKHTVFQSANHLINQTNLIMKTVKDACWCRLNMVAAVQFSPHPQDTTGSDWSWQVQAAVDQLYTTYLCLLEYCHGDYNHGTILKSWWHRTVMLKLFSRGGAVWTNFKPFCQPALSLSLLDICFHPSCWSWDLGKYLIQNLELICYYKVLSKVS